MSLGLVAARTTATVPSCAGVGLKPAHYRDILGGAPSVGFFEVHAENYMGAGGPPHRFLEAIRAKYPLSLHGVGLSIGGGRPLDRDHLTRLKALMDRYEPGLFSEHLAWSTHDSGYLNDLLPVPYNEESLARVCDHVDQTQSVLGCRMLLENPATYVTFADNTIAEFDFLAEIVARTGCGLLLDVNNVQVSAVNHGFDPDRYLDAFPMMHVGEIHLAGSTESRDDAGNRLLIDEHGTPISIDVWGLFGGVLDRIGAKPTLIEWDTNVPAWSVLAGEAARADELLREALRGEGSSREQKGAA